MLRYTYFACLVTAHGKISAFSNVMMSVIVIFQNLLFILRPGAMFVRNFFRTTLDKQSAGIGRSLSRYNTIIYLNELGARGSAVG